MHSAVALYHQAPWYVQAFLVVFAVTFIVSGFVFAWGMSNATEVDLDPQTVTDEQRESVDKFTEMFFPSVVVRPDIIGYSCSVRLVDYMARLRGTGVKRIRSRNFQIRPRSLTKTRGFTKALR
jgi:hypothetical protein